MKNFFGLIAVIALFVLGLSPPVSAGDLNIDQTEFCQSIDNDAQFAMNLPVFEDVPVMVLKYPTASETLTMSREVQIMELEPSILFYDKQGNYSMAKSATKTHSNKADGLFRLEIGELNFNHTYLR